MFQGRIFGGKFEIFGAACVSGYKCKVDFRSTGFNLVLFLISFVFIYDIGNQTQGNKKSK